MDQLIYTNAIGQNVSFDGTGVYRLLEIDDLGSMEAESMTTVSPYQDGVTSVGDVYFKRQTISVKLAIVSEDLAQDIRELNSVLNPKLGIGTLTYVRGGVNYVLNKVKVRTMPSLPGAPGSGRSFQMTSIVFEVFDPYYTDEHYEEASISSGDNCFEFPVNLFDGFVFDYINTSGIIVTNSGDVPCPVTVILDGPKNSPLTIENMDTGEKIVLALDLAMNERLTVTTGIENINVVKEDLVSGESVVAFQYIDVSETSFFLLPRGTSTLMITAAEAEVEEATIKFKRRWVGL